MSDINELKLKDVEMIFCACGCWTKIPRIDKYGVERKYLKGHSTRKHSANSVEFIYCACGCGKTRTKTDRKGQYFKFIANHHNRGEHNTAWRGGKITHYSGYVQIWKPQHHFADHHGYIMEHRLVWEEHNKACLLPWGNVHHKNHVRNDNRIENLQGLMNSEHTRLHAKKNMANRICLECRSNKTYVRQKTGLAQWYTIPGTEQYLCNRCFCHRRRLQNKIAR